jgi:hypothetical protein
VNITPPRPMTHDLLRLIILDLRGEVERITITDLKESTFYAVIHLRVAGDMVLVDSRPSDAIALALRVKAPIFVEEVVLEQAKTVESGAERPDADRLQRWLESLDPDDLGKYKM